MLEFDTAEDAMSTAFGTIVVIVIGASLAAAFLLGAWIF